MKTNLDYPNIESCDPRLCIASKAMKVQRIVSGIFRKHLKGFDITTPQLSMLFVLTKGGERTQKELSDILYLEKSTINRNINKLLTKKYIEKLDFPLIQVSSQGKQLVEDIIPFWQKAMDECDKILGKEGVEGIDITLEKLTVK